MSLEIYKNHMSNSWYKFMKRKDCKLASWRMIKNNLFNYSQVSTIKHVKQKHQFKKDNYLYKPQMNDSGYLNARR